MLLCSRRILRTHIYSEVLVTLFPAAHECMQQTLLYITSLLCKLFLNPYTASYLISSPLTLDIPLKLQSTRGPQAKAWPMVTSMASLSCMPKIIHLNKSHSYTIVILHSYTLPGGLGALSKLLYSL